MQTVAEAAQRPQNIEALHSAGVMAHLRPLLLDTVPAIQHSAAVALGRLANYSDELAEAIVSNEILPQVRKDGRKEGVNKGRHGLLAFAKGKQNAIDFVYVDVNI